MKHRTVKIDRGCACEAYPFCEHAVEASKAALASDSNVIFSYTDAEAVDDGVLVRLDNHGNRATRAFWEYLRKRMPSPVDIAAINPARTVDQLEDDYALFECQRVLRSHGESAREIFEKNIDGGIADTMEFGRKVWIMPNEVGGLTLMFPEDY